MGEENIQNYIRIVFDLNSPSDYRQSVINSIVLLLKDIADMEEYHEWDEIDTQILNSNIEKMKNELDNSGIVSRKINELVQAVKQLNKQIK